jgi:hypothetical protein
MPGLMDFDERKQVRRRKRSSLSAYLGGAETAEAERAHQELQAAFARPLGLPGRQGWSGAGDPLSCSCHDATCECQESTSGTRSRITARPMHRDVGGLLGRPPLTTEASRLVASRQPTRLGFLYNHGLKDEGNFLSGHSVPFEAEPYQLYQLVAGQSCGAALRACQRARRDTQADRAECLKAWLRCRNTGLPVIFAPGIWGQGDIEN